VPKRHSAACAAHPLLRAARSPIRGIVQRARLYQIATELQRDWARTETYDATTGLARTFCGAYDLGLIYAKTMLGAHAGEAGAAA
jgi:hypothetical protein